MHVAATLALLVAAADAQSFSAPPVDPVTGTWLCGQSWSGPNCGSGCCYNSYTCSNSVCCYAGSTYDSSTNMCTWSAGGTTTGGTTTGGSTTGGTTTGGTTTGGTTEWSVAPTAPTTINSVCGQSWSGPNCGNGCCYTSSTCHEDMCCTAGATYDSGTKMCLYTTGTGVVGIPSTTTTTTTGTTSSTTGTSDGASPPPPDSGGGGGGDPCFSREDTTVCRLTDPAVAPSAAFEQCFGGAVSSQADRVPMKDLVAGDLVLSSPTAGTAVLVQQHAEASARKATMLLLEHETGTLVLTPDHVLKIDGAFKPAREAAVGGVLEPASRITKVSTVTRGIISPITLSGQLLAAGRAGAPVVATVWPEWIAPLMLSSALYPLPFSLASAAAYLFPASVQQFYNEQLEARFTEASPGLKGLKAAVPAPVALAILAGFDAACVGALAAWACGLNGLVALLAVGLAATARRAAKKA